MHRRQLNLVYMNNECYNEKISQTELFTATVVFAVYVIFFYTFVVYI